MPRLWLINVEELASPEDPQFDSLFAPTVVGSCVRFLFCMEPGDLAYVRRVGALPEGPLVLGLRRRSQPYSLVESVFGDERLLARLAGLGRQGDWILEPYLESQGVVALSKETGIPTDKTNPDFILNGTILKLNDKGAFRALMQELGIPTVPGYLAHDLKGIVAAMDRVSRENRDRIYLKKTRYCGGMGNISGGRDEILRRLPSWYNKGEVLVEHALDFAGVAGTLMTLGHDSVRFWGVDAQRLDGHEWAGFDYPHPNLEAAALLCELSLKIANAVHRRKARGDLNLDWGLPRDGLGRSRPVILECNFRHNGFGQMLRFARKYFGIRADQTRIRYHVHFRLRDRAAGFGAVARALAGTAVAGEPLLIDSPGRRRGAVVMMPPKNGACALALFGDSADYMEEAAERLTKVLS